VERLEPFVGTWGLEASLAPDVAGTATFEWTLGGRFLVHRTAIPVEGAPQALAIIALDGEGPGFTMHYYDSRGVVRLYEMTFDGRAWTLLRNAPDFSPLPFHQRFLGRFSEDGRTIDGRWESSEDGASWELDFGLTYRRMDPA
jgi:hypothetical protein